MRTTIKLLPMLIVVTLTLIGLSNTLLAQSDGTTSDLGDAPDSTNHAAETMYAYPDVPANFPTVFSGDAPFGPKHLNRTLNFYLGTAVSVEEEADTGYDADADGANNLDPVNQRVNLDRGDDGFDFSNLAGHCQATQVRFTVTVTPSGAETSDPMLLNLWMDWNRSGSWGDATNLNCGAGSVNEWAVRNQPVTVSGPGVYTFVTSTFMNWDPNAGQPLWIRASLSESPAAAEDGSGPRDGYHLGETEDYLIRPLHSLFLPSMMGGQTLEEPLPPEVESTGEFTDPDPVRATWPQLPEGDATAVVRLDEMQLQLDEQVGVERESVAVELIVFANGMRISQPIAPVRLMNSDRATLSIDLSDLGIDPSVLRSPGRIEASVVATDALGEPSYAVTERIFFHGHEADPKKIVIYGEEAAARQFSTLTFDHNPTLSARLAGMIPDGMDLTGTVEIGIYDTGDPVMRELPVDPVVDEAGPPAEPIDEPDSPMTDASAASVDAPMANYLICLRMWAAPVESNQADVGKTGFWKGRGALVKISHDAKVIWTGWLNIHGCMILSSNRSGPILVHYMGEHKLRNGADSMQLDIMQSWSGNVIAYHATSVTVINSPSTSGVNVAPLYSFDSMAMLAYGIQERVFDPGLDGKRLWVKHIGCGDKTGAGSCSSTKVGKDILYLDPMKNTSHRKKFTIMHEFGHALVKIAASGWRQDCSYGSKSTPDGANPKTYHTREGLEYSSCAAGEGFGHFISTATWNLREGPNPDGTFEGRNAENGGAKTALCRQKNVGNCDGWGVEMDWLRHLWDYYSNNRPEDPGNPPSIAHMVNVYDNADWKKDGEIHSSKRIEKHLDGAMLERWIEYACYNGIRECK